jgi:hypothetical protein
MRYLVYEDINCPGRLVIVPEDEIVIAILRKVGGPFGTREDAEAFVRTYLARSAPKG